MASLQRRALECPSKDNDGHSLTLTTTSDVPILGASISCSYGAGVLCGYDGSGGPVFQRLTSKKCPPHADPEQGSPSPTPPAASGATPPSSAAPAPPTTSTQTPSTVSTSQQTITSSVETAANPSIPANSLSNASAPTASQLPFSTSPILGAGNAPTSTLSFVPSGSHTGAQASSIASSSSVSSSSEAGASDGTNGGISASTHRVSGAAIGGIVVGCIVGLLLLSFGVLLAVRAWNKRRLRLRQREFLDSEPDSFLRFATFVAQRPREEKQPEELSSYGWTDRKSAPMDAKERDMEIDY